MFRELVAFIEHLISHAVLLGPNHQALSPCYIGIDLLAAADVRSRAPGLLFVSRSLTAALYVSGS
jgi:hypothetical protein